jgi:signal transduction histidine kinase
MPDTSPNWPISAWHSAGAARTRPSCWCCSVSASTTASIRNGKCRSRRRIVVALLIGGVVVALYSQAGRRFAPWLTMTWLLLQQIMIAWMIAQTGGVESPYYVGLNLAIFASGIALPFGLWQNLVFGILSFALCRRVPAAPGWHRARGDVHRQLAVPAVRGAASGVYTFFNERARFMLFRLKAEVADKNAELEVINRNLVDIKGQMLQQEKMAAIGTLAAGLLHEVNNPVNFCLMAIEVAMEEPAAKSETSSRSVWSMPSRACSASSISSRTSRHSPIASPAPRWKAPRSCSRRRSIRRSG